MSRRIRLGMVGGGAGGFIGGVHRMAARLDHRFDLVAGALSSDPARAAASAVECGIAPERSYSDYRDMARKEAARPDGVEVVSIVTPNHLHVPVACAFLEAGIHVICDKPLASTYEDAQALYEVLERAGRLFVLTHNYSGYPMVRHAQELVTQNALGPLRVVQVEYAQDWLARNVERQGVKGAEWRTDVARAGLGGAIGDIGTHAYHLMRFVTGLRPESLRAELSSFVSGRSLDDDAQIMLRFEGGARGMLWASQVASGHANGLRLRVYGEKAGIEWLQEEPDRLSFRPLDGPAQTFIRGGHGIGEAATAATRIPGGHPEGYLEAFATLYREAADKILAFETGTPSPDLPGIVEGLEGMRFILAAVQSAQNDGSRVPLHSADA
ncbi:Gfo/Idh/MocA family protein [Thioclava kandeliae]|uniref:Gfo/Idh/MocA family oxidoreductase n=1 Tax=Thioclava kandeliae TaxID=3070818 RepID=A0ABV1SM17_9RHOB